MSYRVAINGFGRIGRLTFRALWARHRPAVEVVAINDPSGVQTGAYLLKHDSNYGQFPGTIHEDADHVVVDDVPIRVFRERNWHKLDWRALGVDAVLECSGRGTTRDRAAVHLEQGARLVIISAPAKGDDVTIVMGVNEETYRPGEHTVISNGSCTTNCLAPVAGVLSRTFGLEWGMLTTVHSYTNSQPLVDRNATKERESRAGPLNIIPASTGAARALGRVLPELQGKFDGMAFRVPTPTVSAIDFVCETTERVTRDQINDAFRVAEATYLNGILGVCDDPLVSSDFRGNDCSAVVDAISTMVLDNRIVKVVAWYDNEWGYSCRLADIAAYAARRAGEPPRSDKQYRDVADDRIERRLPTESATVGSR